MKFHYTIRITNGLSSKTYEIYSDSQGEAEQEAVDKFHKEFGRISRPITIQTTEQIY